MNCAKLERKERREVQNTDYKNLLKPNNDSQIIDVMTKEISAGQTSIINDYYFKEIMNGCRDLDFHRNEIKVIDLFGEPLKIKAETVSFIIEGGTVVEIREYIYNEFTHYYYVFDDGIIFYIGFVIEKALSRLKTINIGNTLESLLLAFTDSYFLTEKESTKIVSYYTDPVICEIRFVCSNDQISKIFINYFLI